MFSPSLELDNCRPGVAMVSGMTGLVATLLPEVMAVAVVFGIGEIVLAAVLFAHGMGELAGVALTLGLWILGQSLKRTE